MGDVSKVPAYLREYATDAEERDDSAQFSVKCSCGSTVFDVYRNKRSPKAETKYPWYVVGIKKEIDRDGRRAYMQPVTFFGIPVGKKTEYDLNDASNQATPDVVKIKCPHCGKEIVLHHSLHTGWDGVSYEIEQREWEASPEDHIRPPVYKADDQLEFLLLSENCGVQVKVFNCSYEEFEENSGGEYTSPEIYSNCFQTIIVNGIVDGEKTEICSIETA